jgi:transposase-like protein
VLNSVEILKWLLNNIDLKGINKNQTERSHLMKKKVLRIGAEGKSKLTAREKYLTGDIETKIEMIQALIPIGLMAVGEQLEKEVEELAGVKYSRQGGMSGHYRWDSENRSIYLADQKLRTSVPRVRNSRKNKEVPLRTYELLQSPRNADEGVLRRILSGLSCHNYEACAEAVPEAFGLSSSTISRRFIKVSSRKLKELMARDLSEYDIIALFIDGKSFAEDEMIIALGVTMGGEKIPLGFIQAATENERVVKEFLTALLDRGLNIEQGLLCIIDGAKGLRSAIRKVFSDKAMVQRCQWHKRENVVSYLPKSHKATWRKKLQKAYEKPSYEEAKAALNRLKPELKLLNESALASLEEGFEETLTLHRLGLFPQLGISLKTTNCIESLMARVDEYTGKVDYWRNSSQKQRWIASALLEVEPRLRRIKGYRYLQSLRNALRQHLKLMKEAA